MGAYPMMHVGVKVACGLVLAGAAGVAVAVGQTSVDLGQGWDGPTIARWYGGYQGSRLIPESWLRNLEQPDGTGKFLDPVHIAGFRYLTNGVSNLPVGFAIDDQADTNLSVTKLRWKNGQGPREKWVGLTCSACHTTEVRFGDKAMRVEGGPTLGDFQGFFEAFNTALVQTRDDPAKFKRFGDGVLGPAAGVAERQKLKGALQQLTDYQLRWAAQNKNDVRYGYGRLDAVGHILNKVAYVAKPVGPTPNPSDAPVSYPFLWNTSQQTRMQWSGFISNAPKTFSSGQTFDAGALGRNVGEVVGVFADVKARSGLLGLNVRSSIEVSNLISIEQQLMSLKPPRWPRDVMPVDAALAARGRQVFAEQNCARCHTPLARDDLTTRTRPGSTKPLEEMTPIFAATPDAETIGTDPWMACNLVTRQAATGTMQGHRVAPLSPSRFGPTATNGELLDSVVKYALLEKAPDILGSLVEIVRGVHPPVQVNPPGMLAALPGPPPDPYVARLAACRTAGQTHPQAAEILAYKGRPLTGVWATGPFLHNGSVPTLYDLFLPPAQRPTEFWVGARQFDAAKVGFVATPRPDNTFLFRTRDAAGKIIQGNSNLGHDYSNAALSDADRWALVEYMKVIGEPSPGG